MRSTQGGKNVLSPWEGPLLRGTLYGVLTPYLNKLTSCASPLEVFKPETLFHFIKTFQK